MPSDNPLVVALIVVFFLRILPIIIGFGVAIAVRRMMPMVNVLTVSIFAGYAVGFVVLAVILTRLSPTLQWYDAASISLVITAGIVFFVAYLIRRTLYGREPTLKSELSFTVFDEDQRGKPKNLRRRKR